MKKYDYHTHNGYSRCASKFPYNVKKGWNTIQKRGISKYGISNHFPTPIIYGNYLPELRKEIDALENENILLGIELEINNEDGESQLTPDFEGIVDYIIGSSHKQPIHFLKLPDIEDDEITEFFESYRNTLVNSFQKLPINIWGHPFLQDFQNFGDKYWKKHLLSIYLECLDICASKQIGIEITPSYYRKCQEYPSTFKILDEMYNIAMENKDIYFVTSSDAHSLDLLGDISIPLQYIQKFNIPDTRILELYRK